MSGRRGPAAPRAGRTLAAILVAAAAFLLAIVLMPPSGERAPQEWRRLGPIRATWEFGKDLVPAAVAGAAFLGTIVLVQRQRPQA